MGDEVRQKLASFFLYQLTRQYMSEPLPIFAWKARALCRQFGLEMPKWASEYFDEINLAVLNLPQDKKRVEPQLHRALGMKGNPYRQEQDFFKQVEIAREAVKLAERPEYQVDGRPDWDTIISKVMEARHISEYKVLSALEKRFGYLREKKL